MTPETRLIVMTEANEQATSKERALKNIAFQIWDGYNPGSTMVQMFENAALKIGCTQAEIDFAKQNVASYEFSW